MESNNNRQTTVLDEWLKSGMLALRLRKKNSGKSRTELKSPLKG